MKSASIGTLLSVISLAAVGVLYVKIQDLSDQIRPLTQGRADSRRSADPVDDDFTRDPPARTVADDSGYGDKTVANRSEPSRKELLDRIAKLEKNQKELKKQPRVPSYRMPKFARSVKDLSKNLKLNETQEARIQDVVDRAKRRIEDVLKIPDETGVSPYDRRKEARERMQEAMKTGKWQDVAKVAMESRHATLKTIPGRNTTYADEVGRIKKEARQEIASNLTAEQQKDFKDTQIDPLLGEPGARSVVAFHTATTSDGEDGAKGGAVVVEGGVDIVHTEDEKTDKDDDE